MSESDPTSDASALTVQLLSAYLTNNTVPSDQLAELIRSTKAALTEESSLVTQAEAPEQFTPAISARKSLASPEHIISLVDGKPYKTLKRHLASHGLTPEAYRSRYNLPATYPMVAPAYAEHRREVAQRLGLGRREPKLEPASNPQVPASFDASEPASASPAFNALNPTGRRAARNSKAAVENKQGSGADVSASAAPITVVNDEPVPAVGGAPRVESDGIAAKITRRGANQQPGSGGPGKRSKAESRRATAEVSKSHDQANAAGAEGQPPEAKKTKRRGKLGVFKKADMGSEAPTNVAPSAEAGTGTKAADHRHKVDNARVKPRAPKRMARAPGST